MIAAWWQAQTLRDRRILIIGGGLMIVLLGWAFGWHPLTLKHDQMQQQLDASRQNFTFVRHAAEEITQLRSSGVQSRADRQGKSLLALVDASARAANLEGVMKRVEPIGARSVRASFEFAPFDGLISWLERLGDEYGVQVSDLSVDRIDAVGLVNARVTLEDVP